MAKQLAEAGVVTCVMQYSLYPDALAPQMVDELSQALTWTFQNISQHGGNPEQVPFIALHCHCIALQLLAALSFWQPSIAYRTSRWHHSDDGGVVASATRQTAESCYFGTSRRCCECMKVTQDIIMVCCITCDLVLQHL